MLSSFDYFADAELGTLLPWAGMILGIAFGILAQRSRFCLRSAVVGTARQLSPMAGVYAAALLVAVIGVFALSQAEVVALDETRFFGDSLPLGALIVGGLIFGAGMVLTRGCASRLTVLSAQGNLRAVMVMLVFAVTAYASLRGILAETRTGFTDALSIDVAASGHFAGLVGVSPLLVVGFVSLALLALVRRSGARLSHIAMGAGVGLVVVGGWFATGALLYDEFDPRAAESLAFTAGASEGLFYTMASTALEPGFAAGMIGGVLLGAFISALASRELRLESFESPEQTLRYLGGGALMGVGGVLAGGCTVGAGLTGVSTLTVGPMIALVSIIVGAKATQVVMEARGEAVVAMVPAE
jgi:uncharacterized membrane protein YedE/YeeE